MLWASQVKADNFSVSSQAETLADNGKQRGNKKWNQLFRWPKTDKKTTSQGQVKSK